MVGQLQLLLTKLFLKLLSLAVVAAGAAAGTAAATVLLVSLTQSVRGVAAAELHLAVTKLLSHELLASCW